MAAAAHLADVEAATPAIEAQLLDPLKAVVVKDLLQNPFGTVMNFGVALVGVYRGFEVPGYAVWVGEGRD